MWSNLWRRWCKSKKYVKNKRFTTTTPPLGNTITYSEVKKVLLRSNITPRVFTLAALFVGVGAMYTYWNERNYTPEATLGIALNKLSSDDKDIKKEGFQDLSESLYIQKRLFSGPVGIPVDFQALATKHVMSVLLDNVSVDPEISLNSLSWILRLIKKSTISKKAQAALIDNDPNLEKFAKLINRSDYQQNQDWIVAAQILLNLDSKYLIPLLQSKQISEGLVAMAKSNNATAIAMAAKLASKIPPAKLQKLPEISTIVNSNLSTESSSRTNDALVLAGVRHVAPVVSRDLTIHPPSPTATPFSILTQSLFGFFWSGFMWRVSISLNSEYRKLKKLQDPAVLNPFREKFLQSRRVGLSLFVLLTADLISSYFLQLLAGKEFHLGEGITLRRRKEYYGKSLTTVYPVIQSGVFTLVTIAMIQRYRFVMVPILLALSWNHFDLIKSFPFVHDYIAEPMHYMEEELDELIDDIKKWFE